jgi:hypothetical protein
MRISRVADAAPAAAEEFPRLLLIAADVRPLVGATTATDGAIACDQNCSVDVKTLRRIHGMRTKKSMATSLC